MKNADFCKYIVVNKIVKPFLGGQLKKCWPKKLEIGPRKNHFETVAISMFSLQEAHEVDKSTSRKRALKEKQLSTVQERFHTFFEK